MLKKSEFNTFRIEFEQNKKNRSLFLCETKEYSKKLANFKKIRTMMSNWAQKRPKTTKNTVFRYKYDPTDRF